MMFSSSRFFLMLPLPDWALEMKSPWRIQILRDTMNTNTIHHLQEANKAWRANRPSAFQALSCFHSIAPVGAL
jgi:hypothetical protein